MCSFMSGVMCARGPSTWMCTVSGNDRGAIMYRVCQCIAGLPVVHEPTLHSLMPFMPFDLACSARPVMRAVGVIATPWMKTWAQAQVQNSSRARH